MEYGDPGKALPVILALAALTSGPLGMNFTS
jgi:hypothetical protein